ncbi:hypothetical protein F0U44_17280 [Nocardioides humilatus]|uniref:Uncharacterized protein n=1 Tax=Nocardioides humilatus TaxID=2607660 RepID=A0A5B1L929_9ACTN|nr:hypothetical protein [Nocardioides humilatus]KAA1416936.1 hypothetical protein F0U44_17280 [Nocardioides humilatus]
MHRAGWWLIAHAALMVGYLVLASTAGAGYERALEAAAEHARVPVNTIPASATATVVQDFPLYHLLSVLYLLLPPVAIVLASRPLRAIGVAGRVSWRSAQTGLAVWWVFMALNLGTFADPDRLPPLVRDLDVLAVPLLTVMSMLVAVSVVADGEAARTVGVAHTAARVSTVLGVVLTVLFAVTLVTSGFDEPIPPIVAVIPAFVLGVALVRGRRGASAD